MTTPLSIAALWRETLAAGRVGMPLYLPVAAAFVLLPVVVTEAFGPPQPTSPADLTANAVFVYLLLPALLGLVAQATIVRLAIDARAGTSRSVGEALKLALRLWPTALLAVFLAGVPVSVGLLLLVVPGLYLAGRLALALPLVIDAGAGPVEAVRRSWDMTAGNGWRIIAFALLWTLWFVALSVLAAGVGSAIASVATVAGAAMVGHVLASTLGGLISAVFTVFQAVGLATVYAHLRR